MTAELAGVERHAVELDAVNGAEDLVQRPRREDGRRLLREPVRLTELDAAQDAQVFVFGPAAIYTVQVAGDVDAILVRVDLDEVSVVGEGDRRQAQLDRPLAAPFHRAPLPVIGPLGVHVEIRGRGHITRLTMRLGLAIVRTITGSA